MWRPHCLRLTRELRASTRNATFVSRSYSQDVSKAAPISTEEFWDAFVAIWPYARKTDASRIGLAVSGGVDSMALASLCNSAAKKYDKFPECVGLIVDHKSREGSSEEALWVAEQLRKHAGMSSHILPLQWPENPHEATDFETQARRFRYRALGLACREHGLPSILVAHHADDQAETLLMRLMVGRVRTGMQGIQAVKEIPECYGLHGVHQSGGLDLVPVPTAEGRQRQPIRIETGGIKIIRPLLQFRKERLIATCLANEVPWTEDKTNHDKTLTDRNAIRHVFKNHQLPVALQPESLVGLSHRMQERVEDGREIEKGLLKLCKLRLDVRGGILRVNFSKARLAIDKLAATDDKLARTLAAQLLSHLATLVSHAPVVKTNRFDFAVDTIFPILQLTKISTPPRPFTVGGAFFCPSPAGQVGSVPKAEFEWTVGRQPYSKGNDPPPLLVIPPRNIDPAVVATDSTSAGYQMFDGRFWVRIANPTDHTVRLRPFSEKDLPHIKKPLKNIITSVTPTSFRETLPVLTKTDTDGNEKIIAIPTLGIRLGSRNFVGGIRWSIRYKKIDIGGLHVEDILNSQVSDEIKKLERKERITIATAKQPRIIDIAPAPRLARKEKSHFRSLSKWEKPERKKGRDEQVIGWQ
ncbi:uncharacterized protein BDZ99DRAFT_517694 [Mytilinidion resinicola]|uniref:tRNA(Ile)-lysidine synthetase n=1 Tax=Mytilinidion resinicola TaxID=574789 RepID=A0A6A6YWX9_9PEZI|nr:uncharacterized protein BDZ99DRAFT_517694 [Mytilinidion resinicola]KAF2813436.1 hypothetical protein BDZ99DRAFT_517694 [Mytilinidion resinicola]